MNKPEIFDFPFDDLAELARRDVLKGRRDLHERALRWSFAIIVAPDGEYYGRIEVRPPEGRVDQPTAIGAEIEVYALKPAQAEALRALDVEGFACYRRNRKSGASHVHALSLARDDVALRQDRRRRKARAA